MSIQEIKMNNQAGVSLVELMVTLVLSLFIVLVTTGFYINNKTTYRFINSSTDVQENGRYAIHFLRETIANAGFPLQAGMQPFSLTVGNIPIDGASDRISVQYQSITDCVGAAAPLVTGVPTAISTFTVNGTDLECNGTPLIPGVENLQIEYGVDLTGDGIPNSYQTATQVQGAGNWGAVVAVRLALLAASGTNVRDQASAENYQLLGTTVNAPNDKQLRRVFSTTIPLRNRRS